jgi:glycosyltransferase involved in cell wall biosynthesis
VRFHVVSLPNHPTTVEYCWSPHAQKVRRFCDMLHSLDHTVYLYAGDENEAACTELVPCITEDERRDLFRERWPQPDPTHPGRRLFSDRVIAAATERGEPGDVLCLPEGAVNKGVADALPALVPVEFGVSYEWTFTIRRVFESYAWLHAVHGMKLGAWVGVANFMDEVIPNAYDPDELPLGDGSGDYLLFVGRLRERKGIGIAAQIAQETGLPLFVAGAGDTDLVPMTAEYVGVVGPKERAELMGGARCLLAPTLNVEPFGGVAVEAQMCGTPAITTDWGAFTETVVHGTTGYRCRDLAQFVQAVEDAPSLERATIRSRAVDLYSTDVVRHQYDAYFARTCQSPAPTPPGR